MNLKMAALVFATGLTASIGASATPFSFNLADNIGPNNNGGQQVTTLSYDFVSPGAGTANLTFDLLAYLTVDGLDIVNNYFTDIFYLNINNTNLLTAEFSLGGGGINNIDYIDPGVSILSLDNYGFTFGGKAQISADFSLLVGLNTVSFGYYFVQGANDEAFGIANANITGDINAAANSNTVPEPQPMILLMLGTTLLVTAKLIKYQGKPKHKKLEKPLESDAYMALLPA